MVTYISDEELIELESAGENLDDDFLGEIDFPPGESYDDLDIDHNGSKPCNCSNGRSGVAQDTGEAFPFAAIVPALATALPAVLSALPAIAQTAGTVIQSITKGIAGSTPAASAPAPVTGPPATQGAAPTNQLLQSLFQLLQNPQVMQTLGSLASGVASGIQTKAGNTISPANLLNVVSQLSGNAATQIAAAPSGNTVGSPPGESYFPEYVFDQNGKLLIDPGDPVQHAGLLNEMITA